MVRLLNDYQYDKAMDLMDEMSSLSIEMRQTLRSLYEAEAAHYFSSDEYVGNLTEPQE